MRTKKELKKIKKELMKYPLFQKRNFIVWENSENQICVQFHENNELYGHEFVVDLENKELQPIITK